MRQVASISRPIADPQDFSGMKIRVPPGQMMIDTFGALGAEPVTTTANQIYEALQLGKVDAQENPLAILEGFKLYELVKYVSMTNHMWSGFNAMAHRATWNALPADIRDVIERNFTRYVRLQRQDQAALNAALREDFVRRGLKFNEVNQAAFRSRLPRVYAIWKEKLGTKCWSLVEAEVGKLG
jgi:TRAP-type C4-dicarboxylate transport system substrate-binding protein